MLPSLRPPFQMEDVVYARDIRSSRLSHWRKQVRDKAIVAKSATLNVQTAAGLRRLWRRELLEVLGHEQRCARSRTIDAAGHHDCWGVICDLVEPADCR